MTTYTYKTSENILKYRKEIQKKKADINIERETDREIER